MYRSDQCLGSVELNYEQWRDALRPNWGLYTPDNPKSFAGHVRSRNICGLNASQITNNSQRCERARRDIRLDGVDHWYAVFQIGGRSTIIQDDRAVTLASGGVALIDSAHPVTYVNGGHEQWLSVQLPRRSLISHLGFEPQSGALGQGNSRVARLLYQLAQDAAEDEDSMSASPGAHMQLAFYDLLGALVARPNALPVCPGTEKLFRRVCGVINARFADADLGPGVVAGEAGISLRYLQKLFTARNLTCGHFIQSVRLEHAARLLQRRASLNHIGPISEIAYVSGFRDYTHFARKFRHRFGHSPGVYARDH